MWQFMVRKTKTTCALALGAGACGCGAVMHFMMHPCMEHAIAAVVAFGVGFVSFFRLGRAKVSTKTTDTCCNHH